ncbi:MAG: MFS transporter [Cyanobacteria bacterium MAG CAR3_bin_5]|nr:MFS transporter [Cyanobacteria bacterium MAG CAR3_bin_5]MCY4236642.1 MFS transporter [Cyanobacteria bacterium MAG CAR2_bin_4]
MASWKRPSTLFCVFLTLLYDRVGESVVFPLLTFLVAPLVPAAQLGLVIGLLGGSYTMAQFLATPVIGSLSDHFGRRPVMLVCIAGSAVGVGLFGVGAGLGDGDSGWGWLAMAGGLPVMFAGRILDGATGGTAATAQAVIADITPPDGRARAFGLIGLAFGLGFIIGPGLGGWLAEAHLQLPIVMAVSIALLNFLVTFLLLPETLPPTARQPMPGPARLIPLRQVLELLLNPRVGGLSLGFGLFFLVFNGFTTILVPFLSLVLAWQAVDVGKAFMLVGVVAALVQGGLIGPLSRWLGERRLTMVGIGLVLAGCLLVCLAQPASNPQGGPMAQPTIYSAVVLLAGGVGVTAPSLRAMISRRLDAGSQGQGLGSLQALNSLGTSIGPPVAGALFTLAPRAPFWVGIVALVIVAALISGALQRQRQPLA